MAAVRGLLALGLAKGTFSQAETPVNIAGRVLEGCSCSVPCPCNFGQRSSPHNFCDAVAFFEIEHGEFQGAVLDGARFAVAGRGGDQAIVWLDSRLSEQQRAGLRTIATWILGLEGTSPVAVRTAVVELVLTGDLMHGSIPAAGVHLSRPAQRQR